SQTQNCLGRIQSLQFLAGKVHRLRENLDWNRKFLPQRRNQLRWVYEDECPRGAVDQQLLTKHRAAATLDEIALRINFISTIESPIRLDLDERRGGNA